MKNDSKTMSRLREELLSKNAKNKTVLIESIKSIKRVGTTSNASNYLQKSVQEKRK
jgi:ABC-type bacteriocin/lantibiotic exporter with double-glycine peptidase domain